jgi:hypothetical protein
MVMRKVLTSLLLISIVFGNIEVLMDFDLGHADRGHDAPLSAETIGGSDGRIPHDESECDHCCHGAAHFVGLVAMSQRIFSMTPGSQPPLFAGVHKSPVFTPPLQPPNV